MHKNRVKPNWGKLFGIFITTVIAFMCTAATFLAPHMVLAASLAVEACVVGVWSFVIAMFVGWIK